MRIALLEKSLEILSDAKKTVNALTRTLNGSSFLPPECQCLRTHSEAFLPAIHSDYNYVPYGDDCTLAGPETIPLGQCLNEGDRFWGSSGYRRIPGNTCDSSKGLQKDKPIEKDCSEGS
jgi:Sortilin, neurotensin receptor 3, C-terminal